ncbi:hypothetical protein ITP53_33680 [Nonomuraea sp. K274]|uniref:Uncharacterized protein n=1 Tax=Nonomuraea cypriaca TaxID=1187855 RepID=A0A931F1K2_9ACTN|nr:hypothetical protein [Nonomuraea cypriaca]MBF8190580.1 hypothetical protein [Nonomuraea cypriaca]
MILEAGLTKTIAAGGGLFSGVAVIAGMVGGGQYATIHADPGQLASAVCTYTGKAPQPSGLELDAASTRLHLTSKQADNARVIIDTADELGLPRRAAVIGLATALQESSLDHQTVGDQGRAFGLFQQHPQYGWGTRAQVSDPRYAARAFFSRLNKIDEWAGKPLTAVAQAIQRSASPQAYAKHETRADRLITELTKSHDTVRLSPADAKAVRASIGYFVGSNPSRRGGRRRRGPQGRRTPQRTQERRTEERHLAPGRGDRADRRQPSLRGTLPEDRPSPGACSLLISWLTCFAGLRVVRAALRQVMMARLSRSAVQADEAQVADRAQPGLAQFGGELPAPGGGDLAGAAGSGYPSWANDG